MNRLRAAVIRLRRLSRRQWALLMLAALILMPLGVWAWRNRPRPPLKYWEPLLPYGELRVGIDASYPPFGLDVNGDLFGLDVDLARAVADEMGVAVRFVNMGYDGLYDSLRADQVDALFSALIIDPLRLNVARYTDAYFDAGQVLVRPPASGIDTMESLDGRTVAVEFGAEGDLEARRWQRRLHELNIALYDSPDEALDTVLAGEADAAVVDAIAARLWLRARAGAGEAVELEIAPEYVTHDPFAVAVRADNGRLWEAINAALATLREEGTLDAILARWL